MFLVYTELPLSLFQKDGVRYTEESRQFALTLYMYSPKAYEFVREHLPLPCRRTLQSWLAQVDGKPGVFSEALQYLAAKSAENPFLYRECVLMYDGMAMNNDLEWDAKEKVMTGFVDVGNGPDESAGRLKEAMVFMAGSLLGNWKIPIGYLLVKGECTLHVD